MNEEMIKVIAEIQDATSLEDYDLMQIASNGIEKATECKTYEEFVEEFYRPAVLAEIEKSPELQQIHSQEMLVKAAKWLEENYEDLQEKATEDFIDRADRDLKDIHIDRFENDLSWDDSLAASYAEENLGLDLENSRINWEVVAEVWEHEYNEERGL